MAAGAIIFPYKNHFAIDLQGANVLPQSSFQHWSSKMTPEIISEPTQESFKWNDLWWLLDLDKLNLQYCLYPITHFTQEVRDGQR